MRTAPTSLQIALRWLWVGLAFCYVLLAAVLALVVTTQSEQSSNGYLSADGTSSSTLTVTTHSTLYQVDGAPILVILGVLVVAWAVVAGNLAWRVRTRSTRSSVTSIVVVALIGAVAFLGILTVGPFLAPLVVLLLLAAQPLGVRAYGEPVTAPGRDDVGT